MADDVLPEDNRLYATQQYWDERYRKEQGKTYEWFMGYGRLRDTLLPLLRPTDRIMVAGCGNSTLGSDLYDDGFKNIVSTDFAPTVIEDMRRQNESRPEMQWVVDDVRQMQFPDASFDVVLDKGTMDALLGDRWEVDEHLYAEADRMCTEVSRVLRPGGRFVKISFGQPHFRRRFLDKPQYGWRLEIKTIGETFHYFVYVMTKA